MSCVTIPIAVCTCARAHPTSVYQKRLDRSSSNLLCGWEPIGYEAFTCHGSHFTLRSASAHVHTPYLYLRNGLTDCAQICCEFVAQSVCSVGGLRGGRFARWAVCAVGGFARWAVCAVGDLCGGRFARLAVYAVGGLRGWRFARLAVCAVGGLRGGWRFGQLAVCAVGGLRGWRFARLAVCAIGDLRDWRFTRWAVCVVGGLRGLCLVVGGLCLAVCVWGLAVCAFQFAVSGLRLTIGAVCGLCLRCCFTVGVLQ